MAEFTSSHTFSEIKLWADRLVENYGKIALVHESGDVDSRFKILSYSLSIQQLLQEIEAKMVELKDVDVSKYNDLVVLQRRTDMLNEMTMRHFRIKHREFKVKTDDRMPRLPKTMVSPICGDFN